MTSSVHVLTCALESPSNTFIGLGIMCYEFIFKKLSFWFDLLASQISVLQMWSPSA